MKKISKIVEQTRDNNKQFFILEKYNSEIIKSIMDSISILKEEAKKTKMDLFEYVDIIHKISK